MRLEGNTLMDEGSDRFYIRIKIQFRKKNTKLLSAKYTPLNKTNCHCNLWENCEELDLERNAKKECNMSSLHRLSYPGHVRQQRQTVVIPVPGLVSRVWVQHSLVRNPTFYWVLVILACRICHGGYDIRRAFFETPPTHDPRTSLSVW